MDGSDNEYLLHGAVFDIRMILGTGSQSIQGPMPIDN